MIPNSVDTEPANHPGAESEPSPTGLRDHPRGLAELAEIDRRYVQHIERGKANPGIEIVGLLCQLSSVAAGLGCKTFSANSLCEHYTP